MFSSRTIAVMKRELREKLLSKTFIIMTLLIPVFMFGILGIQTFVMSYEGDQNTNLTVIAESARITKKLQDEFSKRKFVQNGYYKITYATMDRDEFSGYLQSHRKDLLNETLTGIVYVPKNALTNKEVEYYSKNPNNNVVFKKIESIIDHALVDIYFQNKFLSNDDIKFLSKHVDFNSYRISLEKAIEKEGYGNLVVSFLLTFLLYFSLIFLGTMMMRSVVAEKTNRIVEVLLSSVNSKELMTGKIIGTGITGLVQMAIWMLPVVVVISTNWFALPKDFTLSIQLGYVFYFLLNFFIGLITFLGLFAMVGAIFDNEQDAQSGLWPVMLLVMIPFFIAISLPTNPASPIGKIASFIPFASLLVMPARMSIVEVPAMEVVLAFLINLATMILSFSLAGKIYRVGILRTGKKPKWAEIVQWIRYKY